MTTKMLKCNICNKRFHHSWLKKWNRFNEGKRPMKHYAFCCLSCVASTKTKAKAYKINGWEL